MVEMIRAQLLQANLIDHARVDVRTTFVLQGAVQQVGCHLRLPYGFDDSFPDRPITRLRSPLVEVGVVLDDAIHFLISWDVVGVSVGREENHRAEVPSHQCLHV